jgi:hypothetical protein
MPISGKLFESKYSKKVKRGPEVELTLHAATRWAADSDGPVAYAFSSWLREDGSFHGPTGVRLHPLLSAEARAELEAEAEAGVVEVRRLKGDEGRGNKDELVLAAVSEMKRLRGVLFADEEVRAERVKLGI